MEHINSGVVFNIINKKLPLKDEIKYFNHWRGCNICVNKIFIKMDQLLEKEESYSCKETTVFYHLVSVNNPNLKVYIYYSVDSILAITLNSQSSFYKNAINAGREMLNTCHGDFINQIESYFRKGSPLRYKKFYLYFENNRLARKILYFVFLIPHSMTASYQEVSRWVRLENGARFVGRVMSKNRLPVLIPCHRVIRKDGGLGGYSAGISIKKELLKLERQYMERGVK